ncbi:MAG: adenylate/guanylate cyclase domain-containing protein [Pseudomonadota bacterium]
MELRLHRLLPFIPPHLARKIIADPFWEEHADSDVVSGAILFADISGFTPLTEKLAEAGKEGPEELTRLLNEFFTVLIDRLEAESGEVVKFSGDALMVLFPSGKDGLPKATRRAMQAAEGLQEIVMNMGTLESSVGPVSLAIKIGIGVGDVLAMEVGGLLGRWEYVIAGDPLRQAAAGESQASPGEIVASPEAIDVAHPDPIEPRKVQTVAFPKLENFDQVEKTLRRFVPGAVLGWLETQDRGWLCVLRPMTVLFIGTTEIAHEDPEDQEAFHEIVRAVQRTLYRFEGSLNKVAVDDKGTVIMALFGAPPLAHSDDAIRGVKAALEIQAVSRRMQRPVAIGVTTGVIFAGPVGSERRFEYTVMGDTVNLSARLMKAAGLGNVLCDETTYKAAREKVQIERLEPIEVKGKQDPIKVFQPNDEKLTSRLISGTFRPPRRVFGREDEVGVLKEHLGNLREGDGGLVLIHAGTGLGKSRLLKELEMQAKIQGLPVLHGAGRSTERDVSLRAWQTVFEGFYGIESETDPAIRYSAVRSLVAELTPSLVDQISLLAEPLGLHIPDDAPEIKLDAELHQQSILNLTDSVLSAWLSSRPMVIVMDDVQWLDSRSWALLEHLISQHCVKGRPMLVGLAARPMERDSEGAQLWTKLAERDNTHTLEPRPLETDDIVAMLADRLHLSTEHVPNRLLQFISARSEGTPFIIEELVRALSDQSLVEVWKDEKAGHNRCRVSTDLTERTESLPGSVRGLLLAKMDRLSADQQLTLKVASVFGRTFPFEGLVEVLEEISEFDVEKIQEHLDALADMELIDTESTDPELIYRFGHQVTQEVAYDSMLFSQRRKIHLGAADWVMRQLGEGFDFENTRVVDLAEPHKGLSPHYEDLARHYRAAGDGERELVFSVLAGHRANHLFRNQEAARYYGRALELIDESDLEGRFMLLRCREEVYARLASRSRRKADLIAMQDIARQMGDHAARAEISILQSVYQFTHGRLDAAGDLARSAIELGQAANSHVLEARARLRLGLVEIRAGHPREGGAELESALKLARNAGDKAFETEVTISLARHAERAGEFRRCLAYCEQALEHVRDTGNIGNEARILRRMGSARLDLGDHDEASDLADQAEEIQRQIGDRRQEAVTIDLHGSIAVARGDYSRGKAFFEKSLGIRQAIGDRGGQLRSLTLLGEACLHLGAFEKARLCYQQALEDAKELGMAYDQAEINARMVMLEHAVGENEKAKQYGLQAAKTLSKLNHPSLLAVVLTSLGHAFAELGDYGSAAAAYGNANRVRTQLGQRAKLMETVAGSALLDLRQGRGESATTKIEPVYTHLAKRGSDGMEQPYRVYQTVFEVLENAGDERAAKLIALAYESLQAAAEAISDQMLRASFLEDVMENRAISYYYQGVKRRGGL